MHQFLASLFLLLLASCLAFAQSPAAAVDFVVVGAGIGGLVVASRLSEQQANVTVLVVEAGASALRNDNSSYPALRGRLFGTPLDWAYMSAPQRYTGRNEREYLASGRGVGGSTLINGLVYTRAEDNVLDAWEAIGNSGWNWASLFAYYKKSERLQTPGLRQYLGGATYARASHGSSGPLNTGWSQTQQLSAYNRAAIQAFKALGVPQNVDNGGGRMRGFNVFLKTLTTAGNVRADAARAYFYPHQDRANLQLWENTLGVRMTWASDLRNGSAVATGVVVQFANGTTATVRAKREVIVAAGTYKSPQFLEQSGVGNPSILAPFKIPQVVALPGVGENLMDRMLGNLRFSVPDNVSFTGSPSSVTYLNVTDLFGAQAASLGRDIKAQLPAYAAAVAAQNNNATSAADLLRLMALQHSLVFDQQTPVMELLQIPDHDANNVSTISCELWGLFPFARGSVHITSASPTSVPAINANFWMFGFETSLQVAGARYARRLYGHPAFRGLVKDEIKPGLATVAANATDEAWATWLKGHFRTTYHPIGTSAMMPRDMGGVVDARCRVHGTSNVRVVDASVFPLQTNGHTSAHVYAVAEKAADLIKADHGL